jgi:N-acetylmuramoyl-L-alanine amidase
MRTLAGILCACVIAIAATAVAEDPGLAVKGVRFFSYPGFTRIVFEIERAAPYVMTRSSDGRSLYFSSYGGPFVLTAPQLPVINDGVVKGLEKRQDGSQRAVVIHLAPAAGESKDFVLRGPDRIVLDVFRGTPVAPAPSAGKTLVAIDPGHGGLQDSGIITDQAPEKALTLELANALRRALRRSSVPFSTVLTRDRDVSVTADERAAASNAAEAKLFLSIHLAPGKESRVFLLDPDEGRTIAAAGVPGDFLGFDAVSEQQQLQWGTQQAEHAQESGALGRAIVRALTGRDTAEPDQAPVLVLRPVAAAAVLVEVGVEKDRGAAVEAIVKGIEQYARERR